MGNIIANISGTAISLQNTPLLSIAPNISLIHTTLFWQVLEGYHFFLILPFKMGNIPRTSGKYKNVNYHPPLIAHLLYPEEEIT